MLLWSLAGLPLGIHNILSNQPVALQVQAQILTGLSLVTWAQTMYYGNVRGNKKVFCERNLPMQSSPFSEMADEEVCVRVGRSRNGVCGYRMCICFRVQGEQHQLRLCTKVLK